MKTKFSIGMMLCALGLLLFNCQGSVEELSNENDSFVVPKKVITIDNVGEIHNELLTACFAAQTRGEIAAPKDMSACYDVFKNELLYSDKYEISAQEMQLCETSINDFEEIMSLKLDSTFYERSSALVLDKIIKNSGICPEVKLIINQITDDNCTLSAEELCSLADKYKDYLGGEYLEVYSNIFKSSSEYWYPVATRGVNNRRVIAADCVGGLLGLTCCGAMSVIWGAAFSYAMDKCLEPMNVVIPKPDPVIEILPRERPLYDTIIDNSFSEECIHVKIEDLKRIK